jgi:peptide/nickel transport system substrate-binding protein
MTGYAKPAGTLRIATPDFTYESVDPIYFESFWGWAMYDPLIAQDPKGNYIPSIAESWKLSPDGKTWTFKIRKGVKFHNGDPLTSADVAFSVVRFGSKESTNP